MSLVLSSGSCIAASNCNNNNSFSFCPSIINFIPGVCPDNCSAIAGHGQCVNVTNANPQTVTAAAATAQILGHNVTKVCLCFSDFSGINCGQVPASSSITPILAAALGVGAIVGIVVVIVIVVIFAGGGSAVAYGQLSNAAVAPMVASNPLYKGTGYSQDNPLCHHNK